MVKEFSEFSISWGKFGFCIDVLGFSKSVALMLVFGILVDGLKLRWVYYE